MNFIDKLSNISNKLNQLGYYLLNDNYIDVNVKINYVDSFGYKYYSALKHIFTGHVPNRFGKNNPYTCENISRWLILNNKNFKLVDNTFVDSHSPMKWKCNCCDKVFVLAWNNISNGCGCRYCKYRKHAAILKEIATKHGSLLDEHPEICDEWDYAKNHKEPNDYSSGSDEEIWWICNNCGLSWKSTIANRAIRGNGCPHCRSSKGEKRVKKYLDTHRINYIQQFKFDDCIDVRKLAYDFYLPDMNTCIEYQGIQHYKPTVFSTSQRKIKGRADKLFEYVKRHDNIKYQYCLDHNIFIVLIPYTQYNSIDTFLDKCLHI